MRDRDISITFEKEIRELIPGVYVCCVLSEVKVLPSGKGLLSLLEGTNVELSSSLTPSSIRSMVAIASARSAYRRTGQDPNRYRPAAESLLRRVAAGKGIPQVNNMIDILNLVSLSTGFSIGGYDAARINGKITFGVGRAGELYEGIGRGQININRIPVFRDCSGAFGTPTSDSERTMVTAGTTCFLMLIPVFDNLTREIEEALSLTSRLLTEHGEVISTRQWKIE